MPPALAMVAISCAAKRPPHFINLILKIPKGCGEGAKLMALLLFFKLSSATKILR